MSDSGRRFSVKRQAMAVRGRKNADDAWIVSLAAGWTIREACEHAGISERTAYRRLDDPLFRQHIAEARAGMVERSLGKLADASAEAVATLRTLLAAQGETVRLGAARNILELGAKLRDSVE